MGLQTLNFKHPCRAHRTLGAHKLACFSTHAESSAALAHRHGCWPRAWGVEPGLLLGGWCLCMAPCALILALRGAAIPGVALLLTPPASYCHSPCAVRKRRCAGVHGGPILTSWHATTSAPNVHGSAAARGLQHVWGRGAAAAWQLSQTLRVVKTQRVLSPASHVRIIRAIPEWRRTHPGNAAMQLTLCMYQSSFV